MASEARVGCGGTRTHRRAYAHSAGSVRKNICSACTPRSVLHNAFPRITRSTTPTASGQGSGKPGRAQETGHTVDCTQKHTFGCRRQLQTSHSPQQLELLSARAEAGSGHGILLAVLKNMLSAALRSQSSPSLGLGAIGQAASPLSVLSASTGALYTAEVDENLEDDLLFAEEERRG